MVKLTCPVTELDYGKELGKEPNTGFGKRENAAVELRFGFQES